MKTFRELKAGDKVYIVNTGSDVDYIRIESYEVLNSYNDNIVGINGICGIPLHGYVGNNLFIHENLLDNTSSGLCFCNEEDAKREYIIRSKTIISDLKNEAIMLAGKFSHIQQCIDKIINNVDVYIDELKQ